MGRTKSQCEQAYLKLLDFKIGCGYRLGHEGITVHEYATFI